MYRPDQGFHPETDSRIGPDPEVDYEAREDGGETDALHDPDLARHIHRGLHGPDSSVETIGAALRNRIAQALLEIDGQVSRIPTPGCFDEADVEPLEKFVQLLEQAQGAGEHFNNLRDERRAKERRARRA